MLFFLIFALSCPVAAATYILNLIAATITSLPETLMDWFLNPACGIYLDGMHDMAEFYWMVMRVLFSDVIRRFAQLFCIVACLILFLFLIIPTEPSLVEAGRMRHLNVLWPYEATCSRLWNGVGPIWIADWVFLAIIPLTLLHIPQLVVNWVIDGVDYVYGNMEDVKKTLCFLSIAIPYILCLVNDIALTVPLTILSILAVLTYFFLSDAVATYRKWDLLGLGWRLILGNWVLHQVAYYAIRWFGRCCAAFVDHREFLTGEQVHRWSGPWDMRRVGGIDSAWTNEFSYQVGAVADWARTEDLNETIFISTWVIATILAILLSILHYGYIVYAATTDLSKQLRALIKNLSILCIRLGEIIVLAGIDLTRSCIAAIGTGTARLLRCATIVITAALNFPRVSIAVTGTGILLLLTFSKIAFTGAINVLRMATTAIGASLLKAISGLKHAESDDFDSGMTNGARRSRKPRIPLRAAIPFFDRVIATPLQQPTTDRPHQRAPAIASTSSVSRVEPVVSPRRIESGSSTSSIRPMVPAPTPVLAPVRVNRRVDSAMATTPRSTSTAQVNHPTRRETSNADPGESSTRPTGVELINSERQCGDASPPEAAEPRSPSPVLVILPPHDDRPIESPPAAPTFRLGSGGGTHKSCRREESDPSPAESWLRSSRPHPGCPPAGPSPLRRKRIRDETAAERSRKRNADDASDESDSEHRAKRARRNAGTFGPVIAPVGTSERVMVPIATNNDATEPEEEIGTNALAAFTATATTATVLPPPATAIEINETQAPPIQIAAPPSPPLETEVELVPEGAGTSEPVVASTATTSSRKRKADDASVESDSDPERAKRARSNAGIVTAGPFTAIDETPESAIETEINAAPTASITDLPELAAEMEANEPEDIQGEPACPPPPPFETALEFTPDLALLAPANEYEVVQDEPAGPPQPNVEAVPEPVPGVGPPAFGIPLRRYDSPISTPACLVELNAKFDAAVATAPWHTLAERVVNNTLLRFAATGIVVATPTRPNLMPSFIAYLRDVSGDDIEVARAQEMIHLGRLYRTLVLPWNEEPIYAQDRDFVIPPGFL